jgi:metal-sulfur cluster biosynthetic enzyme
MEDQLTERIVESLKGVMDPETSEDVWQMRLVRDLEVGKEGDVRLTFRPSSVMCPLGFTLGARIKEAVKGVEGVQRVTVKVEGFVYAQQLDQLLREMDEVDERGS